MLQKADGLGSIQTILVERERSWPKVDDAGRKQTSLDSRLSSNFDRKIKTSGWIFAEILDYIILPYLKLFFFGHLSLFLFCVMSFSLLNSFI